MHGDVDLEADFILLAFLACPEHRHHADAEVLSLSQTSHPGLSAQVVGDLAQFMVQNELTEKELVDRAETLDFPSRCG